MAADRPYHHGALRRAVLDAALAVISEAGPSAVSLRDLARRVGVSHAGPAHHFGSKEGVFTALATEGFEILADDLAAGGTDASMADLGAAYVRFGLTYRAHFEVMFRPDLYDEDDPMLVEQGNRARACLTEGARRAHPHAAAVPPEVVELAAWALVHGFATLATTGAADLGSPDEVDQVVRAAAAMMFREE
jgi:AcrR family transcriptional regulator